MNSNDFEVYDAVRTSSMFGPSIFDPRKPIKKRVFSWEEDSKPYPRTDARKARNKSNRIKKQTRKSKRGY